MNSTFLIVFSVAILAVAAVGTFYRRRVQRTARLVRERNGAVCPGCLREPAFAADAPRCRKRAPRGWTIEDYRNYWTNITTHPLAATAMLMTGRHGASSLRHWFPAIAIWFFGIQGLLFGALRYSSTGDVGVAVGSALPLLMIGYGCDLIFVRGVSWMLTGFACVRCGYPARSSESIDRCPECGHEWRRFIGGVTAGRRAVRKPQLVAGICVCAAALWVLAHPTWPSAAVRRMQSTATLIAAADVNGSHPDHALIWAELTRRALSTAEQRSLYSKLLDARRGNIVVAPAASAWMATYLLTGGATPEQLQRLRRESFVASISAPSRTRIGAAIPVRIIGNRSSEFLPPAVGVGLLIGSVGYADRPDTRFGAQDRARITVDIDATYGKSQLAPIPLVADALGPREIVVRTWLIARPYGTIGNPITWNPDGTPQLPGDALWMEEIELRHKIVVEP